MVVKASWLNSRALGRRFEPVLSINRRKSEAE
jgi:hypothetical protein